MSNLITNLIKIQKNTILEVTDKVGSDGTYHVIVQSISHNSDAGTTSIGGIEFNRNLGRWDMTFPTASDAKDIFTSTKDPRFGFSIKMNHVSWEQDILPSVLEKLSTKS